MAQVLHQSVQSAVDAALQQELSDDVAAAFAELPTADPGTAGAVWNDNGVLKISAGA